jgi:integrase
MRGYVARKGDRWYAVVYEGLDPVTGREKRSWHPAGTSREEAERVAARLAAELNGRNDEVRALTFGAYLTERWLPGKKVNLAESTWDGYRRKIERHILPAIGHLRIRRLSADHLEKLYDRMLHPTDGRRSLAPKTVLEVHLIIRGALQDAVERGLVSRNVALIAHAPKLKAIPKVEPQVWTAQQLQAFLQAAAGHRLFPAFWPLAATGMRRSELLGLRWDDVGLKKKRLSVNRGLVAVAYELHESRGKTANSRRSIDLDPTTIKVLKAWRQWQRAEQAAAGVESEGWVFTNTDGKPVPPDSISQTFERIAARTGVPRI